MRILNFQPGKSIQIESPAKLNLVLEVLSQRDDGYHEIATVMCPIDLWDVLEIHNVDSPQVELELQLPAQNQTKDPAWQVPSGRGNLVVQAAELIRRGQHVTSGCRIRLEKNIPAAAGLGGGSGNAAATILGCLLLWSNWNRDKAGDFCAQLGSDLNFFLGSEEGFGLTLAEGRGERTCLIPHSPSLSLWLTHPNVGCSTAEVYSRVVGAENRKKVSEFVTACETGQKSMIGAALFNSLQLPASELNPWVEIQLRLLEECGCRYRQMTGSGSCCFGLAPDRGVFDVLKYKAQTMGIPRVYETSLWYGDSIERQLERLGAV